MRIAFEEYNVLIKYKVQMHLISDQSEELWLDIVMDETIVDYNRAF